MIRRIRSFWRSDRGSITVDFAILFPAFITVMLASVEQSFVTFRHTMLERGLDMAVRDVRLGTGTTFTHDQVKTMVCDYAMVLPDCDSKLRLEMIHNDIRSWSDIPEIADCTDSAEPAKPVRKFENGSDNDLMVLRACLKFSPIFPTTGLGAQLTKDNSGDAMLVVLSAFVQEPE